MYGVVSAHGACAVSRAARHVRVVVTQQERQGAGVRRWRVLRRAYGLVEADPLVMERAAESPQARLEAAAAVELEEQGCFVVAVSAMAVAVRRIA